MCNFMPLPHSNSLIFWSDTVAYTIHQSNYDGTNQQILVDSDIRAVGEQFICVLVIHVCLPIVYAHPYYLM